MIRRFAGGDRAVMASLAQPAHLAVIDGNNRNPRIRGMAPIAGIGRRNMVSGFPGGRCTVMASHARHRADGSVIEARRHPRDRDMARIALRPRGQVIWRLTAGLYTVMAAATGCGYRAVIKDTNAGPGDGGVAHIALTRGRNVIRRFSGRQDAVMTLTTTRWRTLESAANMARFARNLRVSARQGKAGLEVIELRLWRCHGEAWPQQHHCHGQHPRQPHQSQAGRALCAPISSAIRRRQRPLGGD